jgi:hypothetical protein
VNIDWVIPCRYVEEHDNLGTIIGAGIDTYWVPKLPTTIQVVLAVRIVAMAEEFGEEHAAMNRVRDTRGELLSEVPGTLTLSGEGNPDWLTGIILPTVVELEATDEGVYTIEHEIDGSAKALPINIVLGPPPGVQWPDDADAESS